MAHSVKKIDSSDDPLFRTLSLSLDASEESFQCGILRLSHTQKRYIRELKDEQDKFDQHRRAQENVSVWQKISRFTEALFIALGVVAGVCAASAGSTALAVVLITAAIWRIGYEVIQALNLGNTIQQALIPQEIKDHDKLCKTLNTAITVIDVGSRIALAIGTGYSAYQMTGQMKNIFQIASLCATGATAGIQVATGIKKAQAADLQSMSMKNQAKRQFTEHLMEDLREDIKTNNSRHQKQSELTRGLLDADHKAKQSVIE